MLLNLRTVTRQEISKKIVKICEEQICITLVCIYSHRLDRDKEGSAGDLGYVGGYSEIVIFGEALKNQEDKILLKNYCTWRSVNRILWLLSRSSKEINQEAEQNLRRSSTFNCTLKGNDCHASKKMRIIIDEKEEIFISFEADKCRLTMKNRLIMSRATCTFRRSIGW